MRFYFTLGYFSSRLLSEYFSLALKKLKAQFVSFVSFLFYCIPLLFITGRKIIFSHFDYLFCCFVLILVTPVFCCGVIENRDISLVSKI